MIDAEMRDIVGKAKLLTEPRTPVSEVATVCAAVRA